MRRRQPCIFRRSRPETQEPWSWRGEKAPLWSGFRLPVVFGVTVAPAGLAPAERRIGHYRADVLPRWAFSAAADRPGPGRGSGKREGVTRPGFCGQSFAPLGQAQRGQSKDQQKSEPSLRYGARSFHYPTLVFTSATARRDRRKAYTSCLGRRCSADTNRRSA